MRLMLTRAFAAGLSLTLVGLAAAAPTKKPSDEDLVPGKPSKPPKAPSASTGRPRPSSSGSKIKPKVGGQGKAPAPPRPSGPSREVVALRRQIDDLESAQSNLKAQLANSQSRAQELQGEVTSLKGELNARTTEDQVRQLRARNTDLDTQVQTQRKKANDATAEVERLTSKVTQLTDERDSAKSLLTDSTRSLERANERLDEMTRRYDQRGTELDKLVRENAALDAQVDALLKQVEDLQKAGKPDLATVTLVVERDTGEKPTSIEVSIGMGETTTFVVDERRKTFKFMAPTGARVVKIRPIVGDLKAGRQFFRKPLTIAAGANRLSLRIFIDDSKGQVSFD